MERVNRITSGFVNVFLRTKADFTPALTGQTDVAVTVVDTVLNRDNLVS